MNKEQKKYDVFISYSHEDKIVAEGICGYLESNKIRCFIDYRDIPKGASWPSIIPFAIRNSGLMLAVFSKNFNTSEETDNELTIAANRKIPVLVFRITDDSFDGTKEYFLTKSNWIEAFPEPERCFGELYNNICILLGINKNDSPTIAFSNMSNRLEKMNGEEYVQKGFDILKSNDGDHEMATYNFRKAAKVGHPEGEYRLGLAYFKGDGISHSPEDSIVWFKKAVDHNHPKAMEMLAKIYHYGIWQERNTLRALELYTKSAELGNGSAMKTLGKLFHTGEIGVQDEQRSSEYYERAFEILYEQAIGENDAEAQYTLGNSYLDGDGVKQNYSQAINMFKRAITHNYAAAFNGLGLCYASGLGVAQDFVKEFELQLKSAELGNPVAMKNVAIKYLNGEGTEKNEKKYIEWIRKAADCGYACAQCSIGIDYNIGTVCEKDLQLAQTWYEKAIKGGDYQALWCLAYMYENDDIIDANSKQKAFQLYKQAAMQGYISAYVNVAHCYYHGIGTEENDIEALRWYEKVAEVYEEMKAKGEKHFVEEGGAGVVQFCNFDIVKEQFANAFENIAWIYRNSKTVEHNASLAIKWENISKVLKGEDIDVEQLEDIKQLEVEARKNNVKAVEKLLSIFDENQDEIKLQEWATFAIENKIFVKEADRMAGWDHVDLVLRKANVKDHQIYVDYIKSYLDKGGNDNCHALYNAACEEYKKGNLTLTKENWALIRKDAESLLELGRQYYFGAGYLRVRQKHFDILFPDYNPSTIANGDFSNERDFKLFYVSNTDYASDLFVSDGIGTNIFSPMKKDKSYHKVVESNNGKLVHAEDFDKAIKNFIDAYYTLCSENYFKRERIDDFQFKMLVPFCSPEQIQRYCMQAMKALISVRTLFMEQWKDILSNIKDLDKLLDIAEVTDNTDLQLLLISYVELQIEAKEIFRYAMKLDRLYLDNDRIGIAAELNAYVKRLDENGIEHNLPYYSEDDIPEGCCCNNSEDEALDEEDAGINDYDDVISDTPENLCIIGDDYYYGRNGKQKDLTEAFNYFKQAAEKGYAYAQYSVAYCYEKGQGTDINLLEAEKWYRKSAEQGNSSAQYSLGEMYYDGRGFEQNYSEAVVWLKKSAEQGNSSAQCTLGVCYEFGRGLNKDLTEAVSWYKKSAEQGHQYAQCNIGYCYLTSIGVEQDYTEAVNWFRKSAEQNNARAQELLGDCYYKGYGVKQDYKHAKDWYEKAIKQGRDTAKKSLEEILSKEKKPHHLVKVEGKYGYADINNRIVIPCQWTKAEMFSEGVALVWDGNKLGAINEEGQYYFPCQIECEKANYLGHNLIRVQDSSALYSIYNLKGKDIEFMLFSEMDDKFVGGYVYAKKYRLFRKDKPGKINTEGKFIED